MNNPPELPLRVSQLEREVAQLRRRIAQLESPDVHKAEVLEQPSPVPPTAPPPPIPAIPVTKPTPPPLVAPPTPPANTPPPLPAAPSRIRELLGACHLLPPKSGESGEAQIGGWWATRIGALLAVIGVVFLGVYVSANTPSWVKWLELAAIAGGVTWAGGWLQRRGLRVGPVITGAGHALIFFAAFAAYAVAPVKIVDSATVAAALQAAAVAFIGWSGWRRQSSTTATMAVLLGYVSAYFSYFANFHAMAGFAGIILAIAAVALHLRRGWLVPVYCSVVLTHLLNILLINTEWHQQILPNHALTIFSLITLTFGVHLWSVIREVTINGGPVGAAQRRLQAINSSLAILAGLIATNIVYHGPTGAQFLASAGLVLLAVTLWAYRTIPSDRLVGMWGVKAASLFALAAMAQFDARTRWIALAVEALVLLAAAHRSHRNSMRVAALGVWIFSFLFFANEIGGLRHNLLSADGLAAGFFLLASFTLFEGLYRQWLNDTKSRNILAGVLGAAAAAPVAVFSREVFDQSWAPVSGLVLTIVLGGIIARFRSRTLIPAAGVAFLAAHASVQLFDSSQFGLTWLWAGAAPIGLLSLAAGWWLGTNARSSDGSDSSSRTALGFVLGSLGALALSSALLQTMPNPQGLAAAVGVGVVIAAIGLRHAGPAITVAGMTSSAITFVLFLVHAGTITTTPDNLIWVRLAMVGVPAWWILGSGRPAEDRPQMELGNIIVAVVSVPLAWIAIGDQFTPLGQALGLTLVGTIFTLTAARCKVGAAYAAASILALLGLLRLTENEYWMNIDGAVLSLVGVAVLILGIAIQPLWAQRQPHHRSDQVNRVWLGVHAIAAAWAITTIALNTHAVWADYGTVLWATGGIVLFGLGIAGRARIHRLTGLVLLVLCIPRVFLHDIEAAKHRIAAFIVLGLLLLWVGFSYQKFRHLIDGSTGPDNKEPDEES